MGVVWEERIAGLDLEFKLHFRYTWVYCYLLSLLECAWKFRNSNLANWLSPPPPPPHTPISTGTDVKTVLNILVYRSNSQRQQIRSTYKTFYGKVLSKYCNLLLNVDFEGLLSIVCDIMGWHLARLRCQPSALAFFCYLQDLVQELKSALSGHFEDVIVALMMTPTEYDAYELRQALKVSKI